MVAMLHRCAAEAVSIGVSVISIRGSITQTSVLRNNNVVSLMYKRMCARIHSSSARVCFAAMAAVQRFTFYCLRASAP